MFEKYNEGARRSVFMARYEASQACSGYIETEHLVLGILLMDKGLAARLQMTSDKTEAIRKAIHKRYEGKERLSTSVDLPLSEDAKRALHKAADEANRLNHAHIGTEHLLLGVFLEEGSFGAALLSENRLTQGQLELEAARSASGPVPGQPPSGEPPSPQPAPDPTLAVVRNLLDAAKAGTISPVVGRQRELDRIIHILARRTRNNPLLVGEPGVGKTALLEGLAQRIADYNIPASLEDRAVFIVDASSLIAPSRRSRSEELPQKVIAHIALQRPAILCVDGLLDFAASPGWGAVEATHVLEVLSRSGIQCIATGTPAGYRRAFHNAGMLVRHFEVVEVPPPTAEEAVAILTRLKPQYEEFHGVEFGEGVIEAAVIASGRFLPQRRLPDRAIDLIDDAGARAKVRAERPMEEVQAKRRADQLYREMKEALARHEHERSEKLAEEERQAREKLRLLREARKKPQTVTTADLEEAIAERVGVPVDSVRAVLAQRKGREPQVLAQQLAEAVRPDQHAWLPLLASYLAGCSAEEAQRLAEAIGSKVRE